MSEICILTIQCVDRPGIVAAVAACLAGAGGNILEAAQFGDRSTGKFFMRIEFEVNNDRNLETLTSEFSMLAVARDMEWVIRRKSDPRKILFLVSKFDHCLADLLYRQQIKELNFIVAGIIGNHPPALNTSWTNDVPYHYFPVTKETKVEQEAKIKNVIETSGADLVVLARYMQILSDDLSSFLSGRCINIHHSFLPGFKGAKPYHQAYARGVKMIGATAHYVTADLDEGPIIHQDVEAISHADVPAELIRKGRDIERRVLSEAVRLHLENRVLLDGDKTVVFKN